MISEKNLKDLIRAIIANGTGYAAKIALDNLCPPCQNIMSGLQDWTTKNQQRGQKHLPAGHGRR